ncbi:MAG: alpha/beta hydrolase [Burkholderiales bacterium]|nr:alpha/beta hydrolase [Burkholderiales bacterium]
MNVKNPGAIETVNGTGVCISRQPGRPLILLVRMASREMGVWDSAWDFLCGYFTVAQFDLEMPSAATLEDPRTAFAKLSADCVRIADGLGFRTFHMIGWTGGAHVALRCAVDNPGRLRSCTLLSPFCPLPDMRPLEKGLEFMQSLMEHGGRELYSYYWFMSGFSPEFLYSEFDKVKAMVDARMSGDRFIKTDTRRALQWILALRGFWVDDRELEKLELPVLVVGPGLDSGFVGPTSRMAALLHTKIPGSKLKFAENRGSLFLLEAPEMFPELTREFFSQVARQ